MEKSIPAASRIRFFTYSGCKAVNIALIVPPMQYPSRLTFASAGALADLPHDVAEVAVDIVVQREMAIGVGGRAPIDQVGVETGLDEVGDDALVGQDVEDVGTVDQREDEQQGRFVLHLPVARVMEQLQMVFFVDDLGRRGPLLHALGLGDDSRQARRAAGIGHPFVDHRLLCLEPDIAAAVEHVHDPCG